MVIHHNLLVPCTKAQTHREETASRQTELQCLFDEWAHLKVCLHISFSGCCPSLCLDVCLPLFLLSSHAFLPALHFVCWPARVHVCLGFPIENDPMSKEVTLTGRLIQNPPNDPPLPFHTADLSLPLHQHISGGAAFLPSILFAFVS